MKLWQTAGIVALVGSGCQQGIGYEEEKEYNDIPSYRESDSLAGLDRCIANYADRNNDGVITDGEIIQLMGNIANVNGFKYVNPYFIDRNGSIVGFEKRKEMFSNYHSAE